VRISTPRERSAILVAAGPRGGADGSVKQGRPMSNRQRSPVSRRFWALALCALAAGASAAEWPAVSRDELAMTEEPAAPHAPAIVLYRQVDRNDAEAIETVYERIKVLAAEGRRYADVQIYYVDRQQSIRNLEARTLRPDGTIAVFDGTVYDKPVVKARGLRLMSKTFTLPDVQVGSIIEYRFRRSMYYG
jgi:hypothetical protein